MELPKEVRGRNSQEVCAVRLSPGRGRGVSHRGGRSSSGARNVHIVRTRVLAQANRQCVQQEGLQIADGSDLGRDVDSPDARQREVRRRRDDAETRDAGSADPPGGEERPDRLSKLLCTGSSRRHHRPGAVQPCAEDSRNVQFQAGSFAVSLRRQAGVSDLRPKADPAAQRCAGQ